MNKHVGGSTLLDSMKNRQKALSLSMNYSHPPWVAIYTEGPKLTTASNDLGHVKVLLCKNNNL